MATTTQACIVIGAVLGAGLLIAGAFYLGIRLGAGLVWRAMGERGNPTLRENRGPVMQQEELA